jgi:hypothetical protein
LDKLSAAVLGKILVETTNCQRPLILKIRSAFSSYVSLKFNTFFSHKFLWNEH